MMSFMQFPGNNDMTQKAKSLNTRKIEPNRQYDWEILENHGLATKLIDELCHTYDDGFEDEGLLRIFRNEDPIYKELLVEFLASFELLNDEQDDTFNTRPIINFRLCGEWCRISLLEFGIYMGLQDSDVDRRIYKKHLDEATVLDPPGFELRSFWPEIGMIPYNPRNSREAHLKNPYLRIIHRYLAWTVLYNPQPEKINEVQIKGMYYSVHREHRWHLPYAMALMFKAVARGDGKTLNGGQFVTTIANNLGRLTNRVKSGYARPLKHEVKGYHTMHLAMIFKKNDGIYSLYEENESKPGGPTADASVGPSSSRNTRRRPAADRSAREDVPINLDLIARQNDRLGYYNDDLQRMIWAADQRAQARFMTTYVGDLPQTLMEDFSQLRLWDERMGYPQPRQDQGYDDDGDE